MVNSEHSRNDPGSRPGRVRLHRGWSSVTVLLALLLLIVPGQASAAGDDPGLLVRFDPGAGSWERIDALESVDGEITRSFGLVPGLRLVELPPKGSIRRAKARLAGMPAVDFVSRDWTMKVDRAADDPRLEEQWGLTAIGAPSAWDLTTGSPAVEVAMLDTGMDLDHPDLAGNLWTNADEVEGNGVDDDGNGFVDDVHGWDFVNRDADPQDDQGHGSHTAGTVGAVGNNGIGVAGVAWDVSLVPLKICNSSGNCRTSDAIAALDYAVGEGIPISNNSYGFSGSCPTAFGSALEAAGAADHLFVASAGNEGREISVQSKYPAGCTQENVLSVAWLADQTTLASRSNYGTGAVDLAAPGSQVLSTTPGGTYGFKSGTSMAAPHVAGTAALLLSEEPTWSWSELKDRILTSTQRVCGLPVVSRGVLDAGQALSGPVDPQPVCPDPPVVTSGPPTLTSSTVATFTFTGEVGASFRCRLDTDPWQQCQSPVTFQGVGSGNHRFQVNQAVGGGESSAASSWDWTVDTIAPPAPTVSPAPASPTTLRSASFTITGESGARFTCRLDDGPLTTCSSPYTVSGLTFGQHSVTISQTDRAGNQSQGTTRTWTVLAAPPAPPVVQSGPEPNTSESSATIAFTAATGTSARCRLDFNEVAGQWTDCVSPITLFDLEDGRYRLLMVLRDGDGNASDPAEWSWAVDTVPPSQIRIESGPGQFTGTSVGIAFSGEAGNSVECRVDRPGEPGNWGVCSSPVSLDGLNQGIHSLAIRQRDPAGNASPEVERMWTVDTVAPDPPNLSGVPPRGTTSRSVSMTVGVEPGATATCELDFLPPAPCGEAFQADGLSDGPHTLVARQTDGAGNQSAVTAVFWLVDNGAPAPPTVTGTSGLTRANQALFQLLGEDEAAFECRIEDEEWEDCASPVTISLLTDGVHRASFRQVDLAGNRSATTDRIWTIDTTPPLLTSTFRRKVGDSAFEIVARAREAGSGMDRLEVSFSAGPPATRADRRLSWVGGRPVRLGSSSIPFWIRAADRAGNRSDWVRLKGR